MNDRIPPDYGAWLRAEVNKTSSASSAPYISVPIGCAIMWGAARIATAIERIAAAIEEK